MGFCVSRSHDEYMAKYFTEHKVPSVAVYSGVQGGAMPRNEARRLVALKQVKLRSFFSRYV